MRWALVFALLIHATAQAESLELAGVTVTPHVIAESMRYRAERAPVEGARVQLFLRNKGHEALSITPNTRALFDGQRALELIDTDIWGWHDTPSATPNETTGLPPEALTVWTFNSRTEPFGPGNVFVTEIGQQEAPWLKERLRLARPKQWISAITFLGPEDSVHPDTLVVHVANDSRKVHQIRAYRIWLPANPNAPRALFAGPWQSDIAGFNGSTLIPPRDRGGFVAKPGPLPLTYAAIEIELARGNHGTETLWAYLRIKPERFDISGGWVGGKKALTNETFLRALKCLHVNTAHIGITPGYSDTDLYTRYPLKYFSALMPFDAYDTDDMLLHIHGAELLGEPQYGGGTPVPPQVVWEKLHPYSTTRLPTTVTHSDERFWRDYAGLSDYPHFDAYRVTAPSADAWRKYDRWDPQRIGWGAPLETIGDMSRSLRELNRPMPCGAWAQGPSTGWEVYDGRQRTSPTPDEIRMQAYHAVSTRITSLYWFNLNASSLVKWPDTYQALMRIGRELSMLDEFLLEGDAYDFQRLKKDNGELDWDIASVCGPRAALLFALDLDYQADLEEKIFRFGPPRDARWDFPLPTYLSGVADVFRLDAEGTHSSNWTKSRDGVEIESVSNLVSVFIATPEPELRAYLDRKREMLVREEEACGFDFTKLNSIFETSKQ